MLNISRDDVFGAAGLVGHAALLSVLLCRRRTRRFPTLTALMGYNIVESIFLHWLSQVGTTRQQYFGFWWATGLGYVLEVAFIFELAFGILRETAIPARVALRPFLTWAMLGAVIAAFASHVLTAGKASGWDLWDMRATYFATCLTCFLYLAILKAVNIWHLPWRSHVLTLGEGFAVWQFISALMDTLHVWRGWGWGDRGFDDMSKAVYLAMLLFWIVRLWFPERELHLQISANSQNMITALARRADSMNGVS